MTQLEAHPSPILPAALKTAEEPTRFAAVSGPAPEATSHLVSPAPEEKHAAAETEAHPK